MMDLAQGKAVCTSLRARNEGAQAGGRVEEKQVCTIAVMGNIGGAGKSRVCRVSSDNGRRSGQELRTSIILGNVLFTLIPNSQFNQARS
jgi:hypothetical protein